MDGIIRHLKVQELTVRLFLYEHENRSTPWACFRFYQQHSSTRDCRSPGADAHRASRPLRQRNGSVGRTCSSRASTIWEIFQGCSIV